MGLISNDQGISFGLALASNPTEHYLLFDKKSIGRFIASESLLAREVGYAVKYKQPAMNAKNYSMPENPSIQGFWLTVKP